MPNPKQKHLTTVSLLRPDMQPEKVQEVIASLSDIIVEGGGKVSKTEYWGLKPLGYKIKKSRKAHYALMNIDAPPAAVAELERRISLSSDIIRFLAVRAEAQEPEPPISAMLEMESHLAAAADDTLDDIEATLKRINDGLEAALAEIGSLKDSSHG